MVEKGPTVLVLGGDGFCGWPSALYLSRLGYSVSILDNLSRRRIDTELGTSSLSKISSLTARSAAWARLTGHKIATYDVDLATDYKGLRACLQTLKPDAIVHFAEQRSAPYSMMSSEASRYTVTNNVSATHNLLACLVELKQAPHLVHLGSIGVYGYGEAGLRLPEGYLNISATGSDGRTVEKEILYPGEPVSLYHMTKAQDQLLFAFYAEQYGLPITDLYQGIVWGTQTEETLMDPLLSNRFDYDPIYGTVVNRFLVQASVGHPLTVYGTGEQTRAFIHLRDTIRCISFALQTPPVQGARVRVINQVAETCSIGELAQQVAGLTGVKVEHIHNPRSEPVRNGFDLDSCTLDAIGRPPLTFAEKLAEEAALVKAADLSGLQEEHLSPVERVVREATVA